jgi:hypothetical protein
MTIIWVFSREIRIISDEFEFFRPCTLPKDMVLEIGGAFLPFSKRWVNTPFKLKHVYFN